ncbi:MAG: helix-turn-helix domain-containing protein [Candidatus Hydrogenedentes bacterium]|nr:helix-turn-helix domain-containing protein [Candidatus Hydrogenedentota bacterium]
MHVTQREGFLSRLNELADEVGGGHYSRFAKVIGTGATTIDNYMRGKSLPGLGMIVDICQQCGVTPNWLLFGWQPKFGPAARPVPEGIRLIHPGEVAPVSGDDFQTVPIMKLDAWRDPSRFRVCNETVEGFTVSHAKPGSRLAAIRMPDNAMAGETAPGDLILFDMENREASAIEGRLVAVKLDGAATVRRVIAERFLANDVLHHPPVKAMRRQILGAVVEIRRGQA